MLRCIPLHNIASLAICLTFPLHIAKPKALPFLAGSGQRLLRAFRQLVSEGKLFRKSQDWNSSCSRDDCQADCLYNNGVTVADGGKREANTKEDLAYFF